MHQCSAFQDSIRRVRNTIDSISLTSLAVPPQYDLSVSTFSPDGRVFQTDYAQKAVDNSG